MKTFKACLFVFTVCNFLFAWGDLGHKTIAYIADKNLSEKARTMVSDILGAESLMVASVFADQVRADERFDLFKPYHYIELKLNEKPALGKNAHGLIVRAQKALLLKEINRSQKRLIFRYLIHVIGDVHQPLHVGNGLDMGGNYCDVRWRNPYSERMEKINLHLLWDEKLFDYFRKEYQKGYLDYKEMVELVESNPVENLEAKSKLNEEQWYAESQALHSVVYPDAKPRRAEARVYCSPNSNKPAYFLNDNYRKTAQKIILTQLRVAGMRLAVVLNNLAETYKTTEPKYDLEATLKSVETLFDK